MLALGVWASGVHVQAPGRSCFRVQCRMLRVPCGTAFGLLPLHTPLRGWAYLCVPRCGALPREVQGSGRGFGRPGPLNPTLNMPPIAHPAGRAKARQISIGCATSAGWAWSGGFGMSPWILFFSSAAGGAYWPIAIRCPSLPFS